MKRRTFVSALAVTLVPGWSKDIFAQARDRTPGQILGPYYPVVKPEDRNADLTRVVGHSRQAAGQVVHVSGRIVDAGGNPVPMADIEVWQADSLGRYTHRSDKAFGDVDPNFQGYAALKADDRGRYQFTTIKPGRYRDDGAGGMRAPHIHFQVTGKINRLVTQMYFDGEALNDSDRVLASANANRSRLIARLVSSATDAALTADWDIVLRDG